VLHHEPTADTAAAAHTTTTIVTMDLEPNTAADDDPKVYIRCTLRIHLSHKVRPLPLSLPPSLPLSLLPCLPLPLPASCPHLRFLSLWKLSATE